MIQVLRAVAAIGRPPPGHPARVFEMQVGYVTGKLSRGRRLK